MTLVRRQETRPSAMGNWNLANSSPVAALLGDFDQLFNELTTPLYSRAQWAQGYPVDLFETGEEVILEMAVPGIKVDDLDISIEGRQLSIRGVLSNAAGDDRRYWLQSIPRGEFQRSITLPTSVEIDHVTAQVQDGLLLLRMPKVAAAKARRIAISAD